VEGTEIPFDLVKRYAVRTAPAVRYQAERRPTGLVLERVTSYHGFDLERERRPLTVAFPPELAELARYALAEALVAGTTPHHDQRHLSRAITRLDEYWRRSGGRVAAASPDAVAGMLAQQLSGVTSWDAFLGTRLDLESTPLVDKDTRARLDALPSSVALLGDRIPLHYEIEQGTPVVRIRLREGKARRLRASELPQLDRPLRFTVARGKSDVLHATSLEELEQGLSQLPHGERHRKHRHGGEERRGPRRRR
jgi:hypothetical protein